jgi:glycerate kinase
MNILIAPNSMKGSLSARRVAEIIKEAFYSVSGSYHLRTMPVADGGDGTAEVLINNLKMDVVQAIVSDPLGRQVIASYGRKGETAIIEMASASGIRLLKPEELDPMKTSSFGTGQLILNAIRNGATKILLGVGGSATVDGGTGMLNAFGARFFTHSGEELKGNGSAPGKINLIDFSGWQFPEHIAIDILCDVNNPLTGENGAARTFGPQKGATPEMVGLLESGLISWGKFIADFSGKDICPMPGTGAAGGIPAALVAFCKARILRGSECILDLLGFNDAVKWADLIITGEGKLDSTSLNNKAPFAVFERCQKNRKPVYFIAGSFNPEGLEQLRPMVVTLSDEKIPVPEAILRAEELLYIRARELARQLLKKETK